MPIDGRVSEVKAVMVWKPDAHFVALVTTAPEGTAGELRLVRADDAPGEVAASQRLITLDVHLVTPENAKKFYFPYPVC